MDPLPSIFIFELTRRLLIAGFKPDGC